MFTQKTFDFLFENRMRNSKEWYNEHKADYQQYVLEPLTQLSTALGPVIESIDPLIVTQPRVDKTISRIYRDTRFSKDKLLYREDMWLSFKRDKKACPCYPEFFFVVTHKEFLYGCGYYAATPEAMDSLRKLILANDPAFAKAQRTYEKQALFAMEGDLYKKSRHPAQPEKLQSWLDRKNISFTCHSQDFDLLFSDKLPGLLSEHFKKMEPLYNLFIEAEKRK